MFGELTPSFGYDSPLVFHVTLVAHQNDLCVVPGVVFDLSYPAQHKPQLVASNTAKNATKNRNGRFVLLMIKDTLIVQAAGYLNTVQT